MAIRFRVHRYAKQEKQRGDRHRRRLSAGATLALIILFALILRHFTIIYMREESSFSMFQIGEEANQPEHTESAKQLSVKKTPSLSSNVVPVNVIVSTSVSTVSMESSPFPEISTQEVSFSLGDTFIGTGDLGSSGTGNNGGGGGGNGGMGGTEKVGSALVGTLYDLKTLRSGRPSSMSTSEGNLEMLEVLSEFYRRNWRRSILDKYRSAPINLYATCFYMPNCMDSEAPIAFQVADSMEPSRWVAVYRGRIKPPKSGRFRFWGVADSIMAVRVNRKNVLQCGFHTLDDRKPRWNTHRFDAYSKNRRIISYPETEYWNTLFTGFANTTDISRAKNMVAKISLLLKDFPIKTTTYIDAEMPIYDMDQGMLDPGATRQRTQTGTKKMKVPSNCQVIGYEDKRITIESHMLDSFYAMRHDVMEPDNLTGGYEEGEEMKLDSNKWYDIEVMISEIGGGNFGFCLLIEDLDDPSAKRQDGLPLFQLFRTMDVSPDPHEFYKEVHTKIDQPDQTYPPYDPDSIIFEAAH